MPASPIPYASSGFMTPGSVHPLNEPDVLALQLLVEKRARQRDLQRDIAVKAGKALAELGSQARAADLDLLVTLLELAAAEAERERDRWGETAG